MQRTVIEKLPKGQDVELHISTVEVGGETLVELADFIVSANDYGRGQHFPIASLYDVIDALQRIEDQ